MNSNPEKVPSFKSFDYRIRTNKNAERKMLSDAFRCLSGFDSIDKYRYIGFGSITFSDFVLFHKMLNISDMISIEAKEDYKSRFNFNKPYKCINIEYGLSNNVLPKLSWSKKSIVWLDYDGSLNESVLQDTAFVSAKAVSGSLLLITINAQGYRSPTWGKSAKKDEELLLKRFNEQLQRDVPSWIKGSYLQGDEMAKTCQKIIYDEIKASLRDRNGLSAPDEVMEFEPNFNFIYSDNAKMLTVGGVFYKRKDLDKLKSCKFEKMGFLQHDLYEIKLPIITPRERHILNQQLPKGAIGKLKSIGLTDDEIKNYAELYRYSPSFAEVELT